MSNVSPRWTFPLHARNTHRQDPLEEEFFAAAKASAAEALVRESIQNSLDAHTEYPVRVRFHVGTVVDNAHRGYFDVLMDHVQKALPKHVITHDEKQCRFLLVEDFNTTGLRGSVTPEEEQAEAEPEKNSFWFYAWYTGKSSKVAGGKKGTWGVGKIVFPFISGIKTTFAYSERSDGQQPPAILFGKSVLKHHRLNGKSYQAYGWFGAQDAEGNDIPTSGIHIDDFREQWGIERNTGESGLSVVVPHLHSSISLADIRRHILKDYYYEILAGKLICELSEDANVAEAIEASTLLEKLERAAESDAAFHDVAGFARMLHGHVQGARSDFSIDLSHNSNKWPDAPLQEDELGVAKDMLAAGATISIEVLIALPHRADSPDADENPKSDTFKVLIKAAAGRRSAAFFRQGLLISQAQTDKLSDVLAIVIIEKTDGKSPNLAEVLAQAEGPAHESWTYNGDKFKQFVPKSLAQEAISAVKKSAKSLVRQINEIGVDKDFELFARFFPTSDTGRGKTKGKDAGESQPGIVVPPIPEPDPAVATVTPTQSGFTITASKNWEPGKKILVKVAYQVRNGNSMGAWLASDFVLREKHLQSHLATVKFEDSNASAGAGNVAIICPTDRDFKVEFGDFYNPQDARTWRDLDVQCALTDMQGAKQ